MLSFCKLYLIAFAILRSSLLLIKAIAGCTNEYIPEHRKLKCLSSMIMKNNRFYNSTSIFISREG